MTEVEDGEGQGERSTPFRTHEYARSTTKEKAGLQTKWALFATEAALQHFDERMLVSRQVSDGHSRKGRNYRSENAD